MSTGLVIVLVVSIISTAFIVAVAISPGPAKPRERCLFQDMSWQVAGETIGVTPCGGPPEYRYAVWAGHPAESLNGSVVCERHVASLDELATKLGRSGL